MAVPRQPDTRPTLEDVAAKAGVSRATASRVLNASPRVSPEAKDAVMAAMAALGYQPNQAARTLVTRRTGAIAVVFSEPEQPRIFDDPHFARVISTAAAELSAADNQMVLLLVHSREDERRVRQFLSGGHVDGALMFTPHHGDPLPALARELALPMVFGGRPWGSLRGIHSVDNDNVGGAVLATEHLVGLDRRRIVTVAGPEDELSAVHRMTGWRTASGVDDATAARWSACGDFTREGGQRAMAELLDRVPGLDAVFVASDLMAAGALQALRHAGRRVPEDVAVVGFDDHPMIAPHTEPPLTSVRQDPVVQVQRMAHRLHRLLRGEDPRPRREVLPVELVRRASA